MRNHRAEPTIAPSLKRARPAPEAADPAARRARVLTTATLRAAEWLGLTQADLGRVIGVSAPTVTRMKSGDYLLAEDRKEWALAALLVRLYRSLDSIVGGSQGAARAWLNSANRAFGDAVPAELVTDVRGLVHVTDYLDAARGPV